MKTADHDKGDPANKVSENYPLCYSLKLNIPLLDKVVSSRVL